MSRVLVVEDDRFARTMMTSALASLGVEIVEATDGERALELIASWRPDVALVDIGLPKMSGLEVLRRTVASTDTAVILVSGRAEEGDRVLGFDLGADDYVVKPFFARELCARVQASLRRRTARPNSSQELLSFEGLSIDAGSREVEVLGRSLRLPAKEYELLLFLARSPRRVFSRDELLANVWRSSSEWQKPTTITEHVRRLRQRIEEAGGDPDWVRTLRGAGYRFDLAPRAAA